MDVLHWLSQNHALATRGISPGIIPMVLIPLTAVTVGITSLAGIIAGQHGRNFMRLVDRYILKQFILTAIFALIVSNLPTSTTVLTVPAAPTVSVAWVYAINPTTCIINRIRKRNIRDK